MKRLVWTVILHLALAGCASYQQKPIGPAKFYPPLPQQPRLQLLHTINTEADLGVRRNWFAEYIKGPVQAQIELGRCYDLGTSSGKIYAVDRSAKKVAVLDLAANKISYFPDQGPGKLAEPAGIWISEQDEKYIADMRRRQVIVFDAEDNFKKTYGGKDILEKPVDVVVSQTAVFICDIDRHQVVVLEKESGRLKQTIGSKGKQDGELYKPTHVVLDSRGRLFVTDAFNFRIQQFDAEGKWLKTIGSLGDDPGSFARPKGLAVDRQDRLYVVDAAFENVQLFNVESKQLLLHFGGDAKAADRISLPAGIHVDYDNVDLFASFAHAHFKLQYIVYVCNMNGPNKIVVYGFGDYTEP